MKKKILFFLFASCFSFIATAQDMFTVSKGEVTFFSDAPIEDITAENKQPGSMINLITREIAVVVPVRNFTFEKELMKEHFNEKYMESDKYPMASFKGIISEETDLSKDGEYPVTAIGKLNIHGVERDITLNGRVKRNGNSITLNSDFKVALKDHKITVPKLLFENIAEIIDVHVALEYKPYQKNSSGK
ncbi:MAG: YceI family protein [Bacteroidota bacterium]